MADNRKVHNGVWHEGRVITDTDEIHEVLTPEQITRLETQGALAGFTEHVEKAKAKAAPKEEKGKK